eukprot:GHVR01006113.1.p1 GENE.GHVR01006113.1~~GHVR01006113.1.p1  ORF type:complete len:137 (+),score=1.26 GHVR01006113.1:433-843(+)
MHGIGMERSRPVVVMNLGASHLSTNAYRDCCLRYSRSDGAYSRSDGAYTRPLKYPTDQLTSPKHHARFPISITRAPSHNARVSSKPLKLEAAAPLFLPASTAFRKQASYNVLCRVLCRVLCNNTVHVIVHELAARR